MAQLKGRQVELKVDTMEKVGGEVEVTFRLAAPQHEHDALIKHMLHEKGVRRFTRH